MDIGVESTILDMTVNPPMILRPGAITKEMLEEVVGEVTIDAALLSEDCKQAPKAPGMKYKHYAPKAEMIIFTGDPEKVRLAMAEEKMERMAFGQHVEVMLYGATQEGSLLERMDTIEYDVNDCENIISFLNRRRNPAIFLL